MELDLAGNMANRGSQFLEWLNDGDIDEEGVKLTEFGAVPVIPRVESRKGEYTPRLWTQSNDRNQMLKEKPDFMVAGPGNSLYTDLARLRKENAMLRTRARESSQRDELIMLEKREISKTRENLTRREMALAKQQHKRAASSIEEALAMRNA